MQRNTNSVTYIVLITDLNGITENDQIKHELRK